MAADLDREGRLTMKFFDDGLAGAPVARAGKKARAMALLRDLYDSVLPVERERPEKD